MKIQIFPQGYAVIDSTFTDIELHQIWKEIDYIQKNNFFESPVDTGSAFDDTGLLKNNRSVFLDDLMYERKIEKIVLIISKLFCDNVGNELEKIHPCFNIFKNLNYSTNLLSYYEQDENYKPHVDRSVFTILTWLYKEPKGWNGGDLVLNDFNQVIEVKNNRTLIIPGSYTHEVIPVTMNTTEPFMGRYCITQFGYIKP